MPTQPSPTGAVDVVVVAYNRFDLTASCLRHLAAQTRPHNVIVVDNGSTDETPERLRAEWPGVQTVRLPSNQGFPCACNHGVAAGANPFVVLLNNDVDCRSDFLARLVAPLELDSAAGSAVGLSLQPGERTIDSVGMTVDPTLAGFLRYHAAPAERARDERPTLLGPSGAVAAYRRAAWEALGGLDERIFAYGEDLDLAIRLRAAGWHTVRATDAVAVHLGSATHGHRTNRQRRLGGFQRGYLLRRYGILRGRQGPRALLTEAIVCVSDLVISGDLAATRGRLEGWRAARDLPRHARPPADAIEHGIGLLRSLALRRGAYWDGGS